MLTRNPNVLKCPTFTPMPKSPDELAELDLNAAARGLSDDDFENHPAVIRAAAEAQAWATRLERLASYPGKRNVILNLAGGIAAELDVDRSFSELAELRSLSDKATANLQSIRFELKRQAVLTQQVATV
jgi:hypothetical protein